ncbi:MAG: hypothetical protein N5P05_004458 (plasmid) [Chroococcopsis gigantea SAG 12.99]|jgi:hypothetical protein|nr:hypothetical protein [Chlorogloea purpurea SAG 13.99]MDV3002803.1 hypothetical protein [Chroococcopsis gigantea SAG 12.99]
MTTKREKFYQITGTEFLELSSILTDSEFRTLLYLKILNPFGGDFKDIDTALIAEQVGINRRTAQRFLRKFSAKGLIELKVKEFEYRILKQDADPTRNAQQKSYEGGGEQVETDAINTEVILESPERSWDASGDPRIAKGILRSDSVSPDRFCEPETFQLKDFGSSNTINTFNTFHTEGGEGKNERIESKTETSPSIIQSNIHPDITQRLRSLSIPLNKSVTKAIASKTEEEVLRVIEHIEETGDSIKSPVGVFLYRLKQPNTTVEVQEKKLSPEFLEWYQYARGEQVEDIEPEHLPIDRYGEPEVRLKGDPYNRLIGWRRVQGGEDFTICRGEALRDILDKFRHKFQGVKNDFQL